MGTLNDWSPRVVRQGYHSHKERAYDCAANEELAHFVGQMLRFKLDHQKPRSRPSWIARPICSQPLRRPLYHNNHFSPSNMA